jgi:hypothetical protein
MNTEDKVFLAMASINTLVDLINKGFMNRAKAKALLDNGVQIGPTELVSSINDLEAAQATLWATIRDMPDE